MLSLSCGSSTRPSPRYAQISRCGLIIHSPACAWALSEHHGDGTPGSVAFVRTD
ncbi:MAG: glyoxalase superfamily protein [Mycobacterium sp.]